MDWVESLVGEAETRKEVLNLSNGYLFTFPDSKAMERDESGIGWFGLKEIAVDPIKIVIGLVRMVYLF